MAANAYADQLVPVWKTRLEQIINTDDAARLCDHFREVKNNLNIEYGPVFIKKAKALFKDQIILDTNRFDALVVLFDVLPWTPEDRLEILQWASNSQQTDVLETFVKLAQIVLGKIDAENIDADINVKFDQCCSQRFRRTLNQMRERKHGSGSTQNKVYFVYYQLSVILPIIAGQKTKKDLLNIAEGEMNNYTEEQIYAAVKYVGNLKVKEIVKSFGTFVQKNFRQTTWADDKLLKIIRRQICGCYGKQLRVPNR
jgi:hypothetical protein